MGKKTLQWVLAGLLVGLVPQLASADDLDALMQDSVTAPKDKKKAKPAEGEAAGDSESDYEEPDPWERPPGDPEPPPKQEKVAQQSDPNPPDGRRLQLGLSLGYGFETEGTVLGANAYGFGVGLRGGYTLDSGMFLGLSTTYYFGSTVGETATAQAPSGTGISAWMIGGEIGYDVWLAGAFLLRPSAEIGMVIQSSSEDAASIGGRSHATVYFAPGATLLVPFAELFYVGGDVRVPIAFGDDGNSTFTLALVGGARLDLD